MAQHILIFGLRVYQRALSPVIATLAGPTGRCRFEPSCSHYAVEAVQTHGALKGGALATRRLCRCQPWGGCGFDPVPPAPTPNPNPNPNPNLNPQIKSKIRIMIRKGNPESVMLTAKDAISGGRS